MILRRLAVFAAALAAIAPAAFAADQSAAERTEQLVDILTSAELEGRLTGSTGERAAAAYLARELDRLGFAPLPGLSSLQVPFEFQAASADGGSSVTLTDGAGETTFEGKGDVRALSFSPDGSAGGQIVFAGYGLVVPEGRGRGFDSYADLDVQGKIVLVLRYLPEAAVGELRAAMAPHAGLRHKALAAAERGATGLLVVSGPGSAGAGKPAELDSDPALAGLEIPVAGISSLLAERILQAAGVKTLGQAQQEMDAATPNVRGFEIPELTAKLETKVRRETREGRNVIGYLPASEGEPAREDLAILVGAHFDHLGRGRHGEAVLMKGESGKVFPGADDNVSGVAAVLLAADEILAKPRKHAVSLAFWSGKEQGRLGSSAFLEAGRIAPGKLMASLNLDGVGRLRENRLDVLGVGSSPAWRGLLERANVPVGFDLRLSDEPAPSMDATSFHLAEVPAITLTTGSHEDHHRPTDRPDRLDPEELERVARFTALLVRKLDSLESRPAHAASGEPEERDHPEDRRAYTGTIPDYAAEVDGLRLSGVIDGGPAEKAGLAEGDVIVEFAGKPISNIYDYGDALDAVRVDQPIKVVVIRGGERHEVTVTPTGRP